MKKSLVRTNALPSPAAASGARRVRVRVTTRDVALRAGAPQSSVSVVLNGANGQHVAPATRARILQVASELGYRRNHSARSMRTGRFGTLGLIVGRNHRATFLPDRLLCGICIGAEAQKVPLSVAYWPDDEGTHLYPTVISELMVDGFLINGADDTMSSQCWSSLSCPWVWVNKRSEKNCVFPDDEGATFRGTCELLALGHTRIAYATPRETEGSHYSLRDRRRGYERAMRAANLEPRVLNMDLPGYEQISAYEEGEVLRFALEVLAHPQRPTALVLYGAEPLAVTFFTAALRLGLSVPRHLSLLSVCNTELFPLLHGLLLSNLQVPFFEVGRAAVGALLERIQDPHCDLDPRPIAFGATRGHTCAPPNSLDSTSFSKGC